MKTANNNTKRQEEESTRNSAPPPFFLIDQKVSENLTNLPHIDLYIVSREACAMFSEFSIMPKLLFFVHQDQLCLAGEEFKRCSIDTLFYVVGSPGKFP